jgi:uncharacterized lipoprotein YmbA
MTMLRPLALLTFCTLVACAPAPDRYTVDPPQPEVRQRIAFAALEIREVSLPTYAAADEIARLDAEGKVVSDGATLWADTPRRAIELELARMLAEISQARVASAPWPFETLPDARLDLRFETLLARPDGRLQARGQYFVSVVEGRERDGRFDLSVPYDPEGGPAAIAAARGEVMADLSELLARQALR